jgi:predicted component of type VI protein secretion system
MNVTLKVIGGKNDGQEIPVPGPKFFIGRAEDCQLRPGSEKVSRHHCVLLVEQGFLAVRDFGSKNGTYVNGERVKAERELQAGDRLRLGPLEFEIITEVKVGGKKKPKVHSIEEAAARTAESFDPDDDIDLFDLLGDDETQEQRASSETQTIATPTPETEPDSTPASDQASQPPSPTASSSGSVVENLRFDITAEEEEKEKKRNEPQPQPSSDSSRSAADDMLRQFFNRK